jgi:hypothetical protein
MLISEFETLGESGRQIGTMSDDDQNRVCLPMNVEQHARDDFSGLLIEISRWLVTEQQSRLHDQCAREGDTLLLAARELCRMMINPLAETDLIQ